MFETIGRVATSGEKTKKTAPDIVDRMLSCENSRSDFCIDLPVIGKPGITELVITNESVKSIILEKLYNVVASKISKMDVEYQDILKSNGDYLKYRHYKSCDETVKALVAMIKENENTKRLDPKAIEDLNVVFDAHRNLIVHTKIFKDAFAYNIGSVKQYYFAVVASIIYATGFIITTMIDYEKREGRVNYELILKNENILERGLPKNMLSVLRDFNNDIKTGNILKTVNTMKNTKPKVATEALSGDTIRLIGIGGAVVLGLFMVPALIRHLIYFFMHSKIKMSEYFAQQAMFLELNVRKLKRDKADAKIIAKQEAYVESLRKFSAKLSGDRYIAEKAAETEINQEDKGLVKEADEEAKKSETSSGDNGLDNSDIIL